MAAWSTTKSNYLTKEAHFGAIKYGGDIDSSNVMAEVAKGYSSSGAKVEMLTEEQHNFGVMAPNEKGSHVFVIRNAGTEPLTLSVGASTCKCTIGSLKSDTLPPGEQTEIDVSWTVKTNESTFSQSAQIITSDPFKEVINLEISGRVVRELEAVPDKWGFGEIAAGDSFEVGGKIFSYFEDTLVPGEMGFSISHMDELADIQVEEFKPSDEDGEYADARQGFKVTASVKGGLRQGPVTTNMKFGFQLEDKDGNPIVPEDAESPNQYYFPEVYGRVVGSLSMIVGSKLKSSSKGGGYTYNFGKLSDSDSKKAKAFIVLKGSEMNNTTLSIGETKPAGAVKASLGKPVKRETMVLYPLEIEITPGDKPIELLGKNKDDYGLFWVESDNPKVSRMLVAVKFAVDAKP